MGSWSSENFEFHLEEGTKNREKLELINSTSSQQSRISSEVVRDCVIGLDFIMNFNEVGISGTNPPTGFYLNVISAYLFFDSQCGAVLNREIEHAIENANISF